MGMTLPKGAERILQARRNGKKPTDMIIISMIGPLPNELNPVVQVQPNGDYDWQWARGLQVCFWIEPKAYKSKHILACAKAKPQQIYLWDLAHEKGYDIAVLPSVGTISSHPSKWSWEVHPMRWMPFQEKQFAIGEIQWS